VQSFGYLCGRAFRSDRIGSNMRGHLIFDRYDIVQYSTAISLCKPLGQ
jgi:hypothetical protein